MKSKKIKCRMCNKPIRGTVKVETYQKTIGNKVVTIVDYYDDTCFKSLKKERSLNEHRKQKKVR